MSVWPSRPARVRRGLLLTRGLAPLLALVGSLLAAPAAAQPPAAAVAIEITGAVFVEYDRAAGHWRAEGAPVAVTRGRTLVRAPRVRYDERTHVVTATGGVEASEPGMVVRAEAAEVDLAAGRVRATGGVRVVVEREGPVTTLEAAEVTGSLRSAQITATGAVVMTRGPWRLTGWVLEYDWPARVATTTGAPSAAVAGATVTAETIALDLDQEVARAEGDARLRRGDLTGGGRRLVISAREGRAVLSGGAHVARGAERLQAEEIEFTLDGSRLTSRGTSRLIIAPP